MRRRLVALSAGIGIISTTISFSQVKKQFSVESVRGIEKVDLDFQVNSGTCFVKAGDGGEVLNVYGNREYDSYGHSFEKEVYGNTCRIRLALDDNRSESLSQSISYRMFGRSPEEKENLWKVYLAKEKVYDLSLDYGIGQADIDLSGLSIEKLKIHTGSADVNVGYFADTQNSLEMDTFYVKVDLGSVSVHKLNQSKAKHVVADIGFGNLMLDFSDKSEVASTIKGSVGAGNLVIVLPEKGTPIKVSINDSWLCRVKLSNAFTKLSDGTYVNDDYKVGVDNLLNFDLDVSMGSIVFKEKQ